VFNAGGQRVTAFLEKEGLTATPERCQVQAGGRAGWQVSHNLDDDDRLRQLPYLVHLVSVQHLGTFSSVPQDSSFWLPPSPQRASQSFFLNCHLDILTPNDSDYYNMCRTDFVLDTEEGQVSPSCILISISSCRSVSLTSHPSHTSGRGKRGSKKKQRQQQKPQCGRSDCPL